MLSTSIYPNNVVGRSLIQNTPRPAGTRTNPTRAIGVVRANNKWNTNAAGPPKSTMKSQNIRVAVGIEAKCPIVSTPKRLAYSSNAIARKANNANTAMHVRIANGPTATIENAKSPKSVNRNSRNTRYKATWDISRASIDKIRPTRIDGAEAVEKRNVLTTAGNTKAMKYPPNETPRLVTGANRV